MKKSKKIKLKRYPKKVLIDYHKLRMKDPAVMDAFMRLDEGGYTIVK